MTSLERTSRVGLEVERLLYKLHDSISVVLIPLEVLYKQIYMVANAPSIFSSPTIIYVETVILSYLSGCQRYRGEAL